jgi:hypothetical protein
VIAPIFAANWKMNNGPTTAREFMLSFLSQYARQNDRTVVFFPPALSLSAVASAIGDRRDILLELRTCTGRIRAHSQARSRFPSRATQAHAWYWLDTPSVVTYSVKPMSSAR